MRPHTFGRTDDGRSVSGAKLKAMATEEEKKGPKFNKYLNKEKKAAIKKLYFEGMAAAEISDVLWIEKRQIDKYLKTLKADTKRKKVQQPKRLGKYNF